MSPGSRKATPVAAGSITYQLHTLGWRAFQDLSATVGREIFGQTLTAFADSNDGGRDGAFFGTWAPVEGAPSLSGAFTLQCKFSARESTTLSLAGIKDELDKIPKLVASGLCDNYVLMTNMRVTGTSQAEIVSAIEALGVKVVVVLDGSWFCQTIAANAKLRMLVPRVYGLGDLSQILDERQYDQAKALLGYLGEDLATFVVTESYRKAAAAVSEHGFVLLLGEPAVGKSVIGATLAMTALDQWDCLTAKPDSPQALIDHWNPHEPSQFFWVDDAFGSVRTDFALVQDWVTRMPKVMAAIAGGAKVVLTSRDYIYREARGLLKEYAFPRLAEHQVVVDVERLTQHEREQILYNHVRLGDQPSRLRSRIKPFLPAVVSTAKPFRPEIARRLGRQAFTGDLVPTREGLLDYFARPLSFMLDVIGQLSDAQQAALALIYMSDGRLASPIVLDDRGQDAIDRLGASLASVASALRAMEGTFVRQVRVSAGVYWAFHHPTLGEAFARWVSSNPELINVFVHGIKPDAIVSQLDCGADPSDASGNGQLILVPQALYPAVVAKLINYRPASDGELRSWDDRRRAHRTWCSFLAKRCSSEFLRQLVLGDVALVPSMLRLSSFLDSIPEPAVLARLHACGLLPEETRQEAVRQVSDLAVETPDDGWIAVAAVRELLTPTDFKEILERVKSELIPDLASQLSNWESNWSTDVNPEEYYMPLHQALQSYMELLAVDSPAGQAISAALDQAAELEGMAQEAYQPEREPDDSDYEYYLGRRAEPASRGSDRSRFEDVDS